MPDGRRRNDSEPDEMPITSWQQRVRDHWPVMVIVVFALLANLLLIANPGFFNHDEWQRYDFLTGHGLWAYIGKFGILREGASFGTPVRPLGFVQQGLTAYWMNSAPQLAHLFDVLLHALLAAAFFKVLIIARMRRVTAILAALIFSVSPLSTLATGWTAASFDQWYALFAMFAIGAGFRIIDDGVTRRRLIIVLLGSSAAMLSKETAAVLPIALAGCAAGCSILRGEAVRWRRVLLITCVAALPVAMYMVIRFPALLRTFSQTGAGPYKPGLGNVLPNILGYLEYPFVFRLNEMVSIVLVPRSSRHLALLIHLALIVLLAVATNWKAAVAYVFAYGVFLLPVLTLPSAGSHYLCASGFALSLALAWLITVSQSHYKGKLLACCGWACLGVSLWHAGNNQVEIYTDGVCQRTFLAGLAGISGDSAGSVGKRVVIHWDAGTRAYIGSRSIFGRGQYANVSFGNLPGAATADSKILQMSADCSLR